MYNIYTYIYNTHLFIYGSMWVLVINLQIVHFSALIIFTMLWIWKRDTLNQFLNSSFN